MVKILLVVFVCNMFSKNGLFMVEWKLNIEWFLQKWAGGCLFLHASFMAKVVLQVMRLLRDLCNDWWFYYMGYFLKWWYPHFTPQCLVMFSRQNPHSCWENPTILGVAPIWVDWFMGSWLSFWSPFHECFMAKHPRCQKVLVFATERCLDKRKEVTYSPNGGEKWWKKQSHDGSMYSISIYIYTYMNGWFVW